MFNYEGSGEEGIRKYPVAMRPGVTPVPIPNTKVKTRTADDTALETVWESRRLPDHKKEKRRKKRRLKSSRGDGFTGDQRPGGSMASMERGRVQASDG